jgi:hypothetical protein
MNIPNILRYYSSRYSDQLRAWGSKGRSSSPGSVGNWKTGCYPVGTASSSLGVKATGTQANHSHPIGAKIKQTWVYTFTASNVFVE